MLHERKLRTGSRRSKKIFASVYPVYCVGNDNIWYEYVKSSVLYRGERLHLINSAGYSRKTTLSVGLDVLFDNMQDWKWTWEKTDKVSSTNSYITNNETFRWNVKGVAQYYINYNS
jgi:hypothetical protein